MLITDFSQVKPQDVVFKADMNLKAVVKFEVKCVTELKDEEDAYLVDVIDARGDSDFFYNNEFLHLYDAEESAKASIVAAVREERLIAMRAAYDQYQILADLYSDTLQMNVDVI